MARITQQSSIGTTGTSFENEPIVKSDGASSDVMEWAASTGSSAIKVTEGADNKLDLTVDGKPVVAGVQSDGAGLHFDGAAGAVSLGTSMPDLGTKYSLEFVVKGDARTGETYLLDAYNSSSTNRIILAWSGSSNGNIQLHVNGTWSSAFIATPDNGEVLHLLLSVDGTSATLYQNGNSVSTQTVVANTLTGATNTHIGASQNGSGNFFNGTIYRARFWNKTLSSAEVQTAYERADVDYADQYGSGTARYTSNFSSGVDGFAAYGSGAAVGHSGSQINITGADTAGGKGIFKGSLLNSGFNHRITVTGSCASGTKLVGFGSSSAEAAETAKQITLTTTPTTFVIEQKFVHASTGLQSLSIESRDTNNVTFSFTAIKVEQIGCVSDYQTQWANPTQSRTVQDASGAADGSASSSTAVTQVQPIIQGNMRSLAVTTTSQAAGVPADGDVVADKVGAGIAPAAPLHAKVSATGGTSPLEVSRLEVADEGVDLLEGMGPKQSFYVPHGTETSFEGASISAEKEDNSDTNEATQLVFSTCPDAGTNTERLVIDSTGNVKIGSSSAVNTQLSVECDTTGESIGDGIRIQNAHGINADIAPMYFGVHGGTRRAKAAIGLKRTAGFGVGELRFAVDSNGDDADVSFANDTKLTIASTGLATFSERIHGVGGISFGQTASATGSATKQILDHYEEGTWTPVFSVGGIAGTNISYIGRYTRIGKLVYIYCKIAATANDLVIGNYVGLSGLPFTAAAAASGFSTTEDIDLDLGGEVNIGGTNIYFGATGSATATQTITATLTYEV